MSVRRELVRKNFTAAMRKQEESSIRRSPVPQQAMPFSESVPVSGTRRPTLNDLHLLKTKQLEEASTQLH